MRILWAKSDFLHPTTRGGQIRTLEMLRRLHERHEIDYVGLDDGADPEGPARAHEYSRRSFAVPHRVRDKRSPGFALDLAAGLVSEMPVAVLRYQSAAMRARIAALASERPYDAVVCDFLAVAPNIPDLSHAVVFQHNVEAEIWQRHARNGATALHRWYFGDQARRMAAYEGRVCRTARGVIAVSQADAETIQRQYGLDHVRHVTTGVDTGYFAPPARPAAPSADLVFVGSMDWLPNVDGAEWFASEVWPLIRKRRPGTTAALVGRKPGPAVAKLSALPGITVTGEVPDVRPWLHGAAVSIVPLRIGGGTRLKIYESMAAGTAVVSTAIGAEGLAIEPGTTIQLADSPDTFAGACCRLLDDPDERARMAEAARLFVAGRCSWEAVARQFERCLHEL